MKDELERFPLTGRFLLGRLRHAMAEREKEIFENSIEDVVTFDNDELILERGAICNHSTLLIEGFAIRTISENDQRHVVGVQVPGDFMDLHAFALKRLDHDLVTLGTAKIGRISHERLQQIQQSEPHLARIFWFSTLLDASVHRQWILKLHQLKASRRTAHLLAEIWYRLEHVGLAQPGGFRSPLTQADLADMCGTTPIHMNRSLGELRKSGIAEFRRGRLMCNDRAALEELGDFNPTYLNGEGDLFIGDLVNRVA